MIEFNDVSLQFIAPIRVTFTAKPCVVTSLSFDPSTVALSYMIGTGSLAVTLPAVTQTPDCSQSFTKLQITTVESAALIQAQVLTAVQLDSTA
mmetsp:Transcript_24331/g.32599  ORF Transcript_24331/g.32599 Transcript_24331/m.32599 type:complete len:93 (+) Transcript_24331:360-638(+)